MSAKFSKPVAFNNENPKDMAILDFVKNKNFSGLVKKMLLEQMKEEGIQVPKKIPVQSVQLETLSPLDQLKQRLSEKHSHNRSHNSPDT